MTEPPDLAAHNAIPVEGSEKRVTLHLLRIVQRAAQSLARVSRKQLHEKEAGGKTQPAERKQLNTKYAHD